MNSCDEFKIALVEVQNSKIISNSVIILDFQYIYTYIYIYIYIYVEQTYFLILN